MQATVSRQRALIIELNQYHGEIIPGYAWLMQRINFDVDVMMRTEVFLEDPFCRVDKKDTPNIQHANLEQLIKKIKNIKDNEYDLILFTSNVLWESDFFVGSVFQLLEYIPRANIGTFFVEHNLSYLDTDSSQLLLANDRIITLLPYEIDGKTTRAVNPHFFGNQQRISTKNHSKKRIVALGVTNREEYSLNILFHACRQKYTNDFEVIIINGDDKSIPEDLRNTVLTTERLNFKEYYDLLESADYLLTIFGSNNEKVDKYLRGTTSGTIQASLGFAKPIITDTLHGRNYDITNEEAILFEYNRLSDGFERALSLKAGQYDLLVEKIKARSSAIVEKSVHNLKEMIKVARTSNKSDIDRVDEETIRMAKEIEKISELRLENDRIKQELASKIQENEDLTKEVQDLKVHVNELWTHLHSKRFLYADSVNNKVNSLLPHGTAQRRLVALPFHVARYIKHTPDRLEDRKARVREKNIREKMILQIANHKAVLVYISMPWDNIMRQRPHHIAEKLADLGHMIIYMDYEATETREINSNLYVVAGNWCIDEIAKIEHISKFFMLPAGYSMPINDIKSILGKGYRLIYEYIDELDETISGDLSNQKEVHSKLSSLRPGLIIASAKKLFDEMSMKFGEESVVMSANAVDMSHFNLEYKWDVDAAPEDMQDIIRKKKPIIGYYGAIAPWLDYDLLNDLTKKRQDLSFVFIGVDYNDGLKQLVRRDNVFILGPKNYKDLPSYSYWFDAAIIPFKKGEIAKSTSPVKLFEYMAMGLPTVCTADLKECYGYKFVYIAKNNHDFESRLDEAVSVKSNLQTQKVLHAQAMDNTWQARARVIADKLDTIVNHMEKK